MDSKGDRVRNRVYDETSFLCGHLIFLLLHLIFLGHDKIDNNNPIYPADNLDSKAVRDMVLM